MIKPNCPRCQIALQRRSNRNVLQYACSSCFGFSVHLHDLKKILPDEEIKLLLQPLEKPISNSEVPCSHCGHAMDVAIHSSGDLQVELDVCHRCNLIWLDTGEWGDLQSSSQVRNSDWQEAKQKYTQAILQIKRDEQEVRENASAIRNMGSLRFSQILTTLLGLPTEEKDDYLRSHPVGTWSIMALCTVTTLVLLFTAPHLITDLGFYGDANILNSLGSVFTAFFVHASLMHLIGNMYFIWVFGDNVEDHLGIKNFFILLFLATLTGDVFHLIFERTSGDTLPLVGASGGIFGIVTFYLATFPSRKFLVFFFFRWYAIPGWVFGIFFLALNEFIGIFKADNISHFAHIGGGVVGILAAVLFKKKDLEIKS